MHETNADTSATRSRIMQAIKGSGNVTTELAFIGMLRRDGIRGWRRHLPLPGRPDFAFPDARLAIFIDGCFWHGCPRCYSKPRNNAVYWASKLEANRKRDRRVVSQLRRRGWSAIRIWECDVGRVASINRVLRKLRERGSRSEGARLRNLA